MSTTTGAAALSERFADDDEGDVGAVEMVDITGGVVTSPPPSEVCPVAERDRLGGVNDSMVVVGEELARSLFVLLLLVFESSLFYIPACP